MTVLILPPPSGCTCPLHPTGKHESPGSLSAVGSTSKAVFVKLVLSSSLEIWSITFPHISGFCTNCQLLCKDAGDDCCRGQQAVGENGYTLSLPAHWILPWYCFHFGATPSINQASAWAVPGQNLSRIWVSSHNPSATSKKFQACM